MDPQFRVFVAGATFATFAVCVLAAWSSPGSRDLRWAITLFCGGGAINRLGLIVPFAFPQLPWDPRVVFVVTAGHWAWFLLLAQVMFDEQKLKPALFAPTVVMIAITMTMLIGDLTGSAPLMSSADQARQICEIALVAWAMLVIMRSRRIDLVARRRRIRWAIFALGSAYTLFLGLMWFPISNGWIAGEPVYALDSWINLFLMIAATSAVVELRADLGRPNVTASATPGISEASRLALMRLDAVMGAGEVWRRPGLTVELLAQETGVSERQLRRLINERLGYTNFASFLNAYRLEAARSWLTDPAHANRTIAEIAADLGYASIATFNRAFKEASGQTPGAWRKTTAQSAEHSARPARTA